MVTSNNAYVNSVESPYLFKVVYEVFVILLYTVEGAPGVMISHNQRDP